MRVSSSSWSEINMGKMSIDCELRQWPAISCQQRCVPLPSLIVSPLAMTVTEDESNLRAIGLRYPPRC